MWDISSTLPIRVVVQQPTLPAYRNPVFRELASRDGVDLLVLYGDLPGIRAVEPDGFEARQLPLKQYCVGRRTLTWHGAQLAAASRQAADVAVLTWDVQYVSLMPALFRARQQQVGTVLWGHGVSKSPSRWRDAARYRVGALADCTLFYSRSGAAAFSASYPAADTFVAQNTLDSEPMRRAAREWRDAPEQLTQFQQQQGITPEQTLLFVSRLVPENRLELALDAMAQLTAEFPELQLVVVGAGPAQADLEQHAARLGLAERVRWVGPLYEQRDLAPWFLSSAAFVYPDNVGLSLLHAMAYGLPPVVSDDVARQGPEIEALQSGVNGLSFRSGAASDLADKLGRLLRDPGWAQRLGQDAGKMLEARFSLSAMVDGMVASFECAAGARAGVKG